MKPYQHRVQYYETDRMQLPHHSNYLRFMEEARVDFLEQLGWGYNRMEEEGLISPVVGITCDYRRGTTFPDVIEIAISILELGAVKVRFGYEMRVRGALVCTASSTHCFLDESGKPVRLKQRCPGFYQALAAQRETPV